MNKVLLSERIAELLHCTAEEWKVADLCERARELEMLIEEIWRTVCRDFPMMAQRSPYMDVVERVRSLLDPNAPPLHDEQPSG